jgi:hypothetical protein
MADRAILLAFEEAFAEKVSVSSDDLLSWRRETQPEGAEDGFPGPFGVGRSYL